MIQYEENLSGILGMCMEAKVYGIICFGMRLTLREGNREYFYKRLEDLYPGMKERYVKRYRNQYIVSSPRNARLMRLFQEKCEKAGIVHNNELIFRFLQTFEEKTPSGN